MAVEGSSCGGRPGSHFSIPAAEGRWASCCGLPSWEQPGSLLRGGPAGLRGPPASRLRGDHVNSVEQGCHIHDVLVVSAQTLGKPNAVKIDAGLCCGLSSQLDEPQNPPQQRGPGDTVSRPSSPVVSLRNNLE